MRRATSYRCAGCSDSLVFDDSDHTLHCETCGRGYRRNLQPL